MKFYVEEITVLKDGTSAHAITEKESEQKALSDFHLTLAYAYLNDNIDTIHVEAKNSVGGVYKSETWVNPNKNVVLEKEEPVVEEPTEEVTE